MSQTRASAPAPTLDHRLLMGEKGKKEPGRQGGARQGRGWAAPDMRVLRKETDQNQKKGSHGRGPELQGCPLAHVDGRGSLGVAWTLLLCELGLSGPQFPREPCKDAGDSFAPCRAQAGGSRWRVARGSSLTWALQGECRVESEPAETGSEVGPRRGRCWQTRRGGGRAGTGSGALRRKLPPPAQESGVAPGWDPSLLGAGLGGAHWIRADAAE